MYLILAKYRYIDTVDNWLKITEMIWRLLNTMFTTMMVVWGLLNNCFFFMPSVVHLYLLYKLTMKARWLNCFILCIVLNRTKRVKSLKYKLLRFYWQHVGSLVDIDISLVSDLQVLKHAENKQAPNEIKQHFNLTVMVSLD